MMIAVPPPSAASELRLMNNARRIRDTGLTILVWAVLIGLFFWGVSYIARPVLMFALGAIIAYALTPLVGRLSRVMPRGTALMIVYLGLLVVIAAVLFLLVVAVAQEISPLVERINQWLASQGGNGPAAITGYLKNLGLTQEQFNSITTDLTNFLKGVAADVAPVTAGPVGVIFNAVIAGMVNIYLVLDGSRFLKWATSNTPVTHRSNVSFFIQSLDRVMGGYIRCQLLLCLAISVMIAVFMAIILVPFWPILAVLAFVFEFIPMIGLGLVGAVCVPRRTLGGLADGAAGTDPGHRRQRDREQHPLAAPVGARGGRPFGCLALLPAGLRPNLRPLGALFAAPIAGLIQAIATAFWRQWRSDHPDQYPEDVEAQPQGQGILAPSNGAAPIEATAHAQERGAQQIE